MPGIQVIETGVDRLLSIIRKHKRISLEESAKLLGVSPAIAEEWGDFLEDEHYITKEFKLTTTYFVFKAQDTEDIKKKAGEFNRKKEGFIKKAEVAIATLDKDSEVLLSLRTQFDELKKDIGKELQGMKVEMQELEKYELLKDEIGKKLSKQESEFSTKITKINTDIQAEEKKYDDLLGKIQGQKRELEKEQGENIKIREDELALKKKLNEILSEIDRLQGKFKHNEQDYKHTEEIIKSLGSLSEKIRSDIQGKRDQITDLLQENKEYEKKILESQNALMDRLKKSKFFKSDKKDAEDKFKTFFTKKSDIEKLITDVEKDRALLEEDLVNLIKNAKAFNISAKGKDLTKEVNKLEKSFKDTESKRKEYEEKMKLVSDAIGASSLRKKKKNWFSFG